LDYDETTDDGQFSLLSVACIGCCSLAPVMTINGETFGRLEPNKLRKICREHKNAAKEAAKQSQA